MRIALLEFCQEQLPLVVKIISSWNKIVFDGGKEVRNQPRCEGFGRSDTLIGVEASSYESEGEAPEG